MTHAVIFGLAGAQLRHVVPQRVASAVYEITDLTRAQADPARILATGAATVPAWVLALDDDAGPSQPDGTLVPVTLTAGPSVGEVVAVTADDGSFEAFTVEGVSDDNYLRSRSILAGSYAPGSSVESLTITAPVPAALYDFEAALGDQRPLRVEWRYTLGFGETRVTEPITLTRQTEAVASMGPALELVRAGYPGLANNLGEAQTLEQLGAYSMALVRGDMIARRVDPAALMLGEQGMLLLAAKVMNEAALAGYSPGMRPLEDFLADKAADYTTQLEAIVIGSAGGQATKLDSEAVARERPDSSYRTPLGAM